MKVIVEKASAVTQKDGKVLEPLKEVIQINPNNTEYGSIMLSSKLVDLSSGFGNFRKRIAFLPGTVEALEFIVDNYCLKVGDDFSTKVMITQLIVKESTEQFWKGQRPKIMIENNEPTNKVLTKDGTPIYRKTIVDTVGDQKDEFVKHNDIITMEKYEELMLEKEISVEEELFDKA